MSGLDLVVVGMGLVSPTGLTAEEHAFFIRAGSTLSGPQSFVDAGGDPINAVHCSWLGGELPLGDRISGLATRAIGTALAPIAAQPWAQGQRIAAIFGTAAPWPALDQAHLDAVAVALQEALPIQIGARTQGEAGFCQGLAIAQQWLAANVPAVVVAVADSLISPLALGIRVHQWRKWERVPAPLSEAAAAVVVTTRERARAEGLEVLGELLYAGSLKGSSSDEDDEPVDGTAMAQLMRDAVGLATPVTQSFGQHNVDSLRQRSFDYAASRNFGALDPECRLVCVEDDIGRVGAAAGGAHLVYALATERHETAAFGGGGAFVSWAVSRDGTRGLCLGRGAKEGRHG